MLSGRSKVIDYDRTEAWTMDVHISGTIMSYLSVTSGP
jgi:hypothetical protein